MKSIENEILSLAEDIYAGKCNCQEAAVRIENIEKKYGSLDRNIFYPEFTGDASQDYLEELIGRVRVGLYSKALITDFAKAADAVYGARNKKSSFKKSVIIGASIVAIIILVLIIVKCLGE